MGNAKNKIKKKRKDRDTFIISPVPGHVEYPECWIRFPKKVEIQASPTAI